jgi:hypothetical protein
MLFFFCIVQLFNAFVLYCHKSLQLVMNIVAFSSNNVDKYCLGYVDVIVCHIVILNESYCIYCFCAKILLLY